MATEPPKTAWTHDLARALIADGALTADEVEMGEAGIWITQAPASPGPRWDDRPETGMQ